MDSRRDFIKKTATAGMGITMVPNLSFAMMDTLKREKLKASLRNVKKQQARP